MMAVLPKRVNDSVGYCKGRAKHTEVGCHAVRVNNSGEYRKGRSFFAYMGRTYGNMQFMYEV